MIRNFFKKVSKKKDESSLKELNIEGFKLLAPKEHMIEFYLNKYKYYSRNLARIAKYMESKYSSYNIIDIGANIGDSIALLRGGNVSQQIFAVEGEPQYYKLLEQNLKQFSNIKAFECYLGEETKEEKLIMQTELGTSKLSKDTGQGIKVKKLDDFVDENKLENIKLLKIDTDGFDLKILRGAWDLLKTSSPVLFFEYDANYLDENGEDAIDIFNQLASIGYKKILYYDNFGRLLISVTTDDKALIRQLYAYIKKGEGAFHYYDLCVFHELDEDLAKLVIKKEMEFFQDKFGRETTI